MLNSEGNSPRFRRLARLGALACVLLGAWMLGALGARAEVSAVARLPLLVAQGDVGSVTLAGCDHRVTLEAVAGATSIQGSQRYVWRNTGDEPVTFRLEWHAGQSWSLISLALTHGDQVRETVDGVLPQVIVEIAAGETAEMTAIYELEPSSGHALQLVWDLTALDAWGVGSTARLRIAYPDQITDEALLVVSPLGYGLILGEVTWDIHSRQAVELTLLAPATWNALRELRAEDDAKGLGQLYLAIGEASRHLGLGDDMAYAAGIGELLTAVERAPGDATLRVILAELYEARAGANPELLLPYLAAAIQQLEAIAPSRRSPEINQHLGRLARDAALAAEAVGDVELATEYLRQAEQLLGEDLMDEGQEALVVRLALSLAERGRLQQALTLLHDRLTPQTYDTLLRYAPPFASVVTTVTMTNGTRLAEQRFRLYSPTADATRGTLGEILRRLEKVESVDANLTHHNETAVLTVEVPWSQLAELADVSRQLTHTLDAQDLLSAVVASPWTSILGAYGTEQALLRTTFHYQEEIDLSQLAVLWEAGDSLVRWQAVEIEAALAPGDEPAYEQRLAHYALGQQRDVWRDLRLSSYWTYQIVLDAGAPPEVVGRIAFGEEGAAVATYTEYDRDRLIAGVLIGAGFVVLILMLVTVGISSKRTQP